MEGGIFHHRDHGEHGGKGVERGMLRGVKAGAVSAVMGGFPRFGNGNEVVFQGLETYLRGVREEERGGGTVSPRLGMGMGIGNKKARLPKEARGQTSTFG